MFTKKKLFLSFHMVHTLSRNVSALYYWTRLNKHSESNFDCEKQNAVRKGEMSPMQLDTPSPRIKKEARNLDSQQASRANLANVTCFMKTKRQPLCFATGLNLILHRLLIIELNRVSSDYKPALSIENTYQVGVHWSCCVRCANSTLVTEKLWYWCLLNLS